MRRQLVLAFSVVAVLASCAPPPPHPAVIEHYDVLIRNGLVYDGSGVPPRRVDVAVNGVQVLRGGEHTGATPGQVVRGPGWTG